MGLVENLVQFRAQGPTIIINKFLNLDCEWSILVVVCTCDTEIYTFNLNLSPKELMNNHNAFKSVCVCKLGNHRIPNLLF